MEAEQGPAEQTEFSNAAELAELETTDPPKGNEVYLLGGNDFEMSRIRQTLDHNHVPYIDYAPRWEDANVEKYADAIQGLLAEGKTPVTVELRGATQVPGVEVVDHHSNPVDGNLTERPASIIQVLERLGIEPNLINRLAAANDSGYFPAMDAVVAGEMERKEKLGLSKEVLDKHRERLQSLVLGIRRRDREAQGVTPEMEQEATEAIARAERRPDGLTIVRLNSERYSPVTDALHYTWEGQEKLIVVCNADKEEKEVWFFGNGVVSQSTAEYYAERKKERAESNPQDPSNEYHTVGGGAGFGKEDQSALCLVVAKNPEEVIQYIDQQLASRS